jgi:hypothetical protein
VPSSSGSGSPGRVIVFQKSITSLDFIMATEFVFREVRTEFLYTMYLNLNPQKDQGINHPTGNIRSKLRTSIYMRVYCSNICFCIRK